MRFVRSGESRVYLSLFFERGKAKNLSFQIFQGKRENPQLIMHLWAIMALLLPQRRNTNLLRDLMKTSNIQKVVQVSLRPETRVFN